MSEFLLVWAETRDMELALTRIRRKTRSFSYPLNQLTRGELQPFFRHMKKSGRKVQVKRYGPGVADRSVTRCGSAYK